MVCWPREVCFRAFSPFRWNLCSRCLVFLLKHLLPFARASGFFFRWVGFVAAWEVSSVATFLCMASFFGSWFLGKGLFVSTILFLKISDLLLWLWRTDCFYRFDFLSIPCFHQFLPSVCFLLVLFSSFSGLLWYFVIDTLLSSSVPPF